MFLVPSLAERMYGCCVRHKRDSIDGRFYVCLNDRFSLNIYLGTYAKFMKKITVFIREEVTATKFKKKNKVIRPKSRASALSEKSGKQTDEQTITFKKTFELATKCLKDIFVTKWSDRQTDGWTDGQKNDL